MRTREYGQYCGLARAAEVLGQRWTLLILRDLLVGPRRYSDLAAGLPGIPTNILATRLKELEGDGLVTRELQGGQGRSVVYRATPRAGELAPALDALGRWGAAAMRDPHEGEVVTEAALVAGLRVAAGGGEAPPEGRSRVYVVRSGEAVACATVRDGTVTVEAGGHPDPDLVVVAGPGFRDLLAGVLDAGAAVASGAVTLSGDTALLAEFSATFRVPYTDAVTT
ncbi:winged helix-turn-helix transcriptional regulator [Nonomuraea harbinensis]|uniref:Winged helix-turn-helix transcriptional regulator n=1 Tax=Nonomuraea harbinensis TaxID=1286938 RepID=A0ABW1BNY4_9ACTN|nr:helix-turn-helix domain-containing protein [Nonomuraea harbinensis]